MNGNMKQKYKKNSQNDMFYNNFTNYCSYLPSDNNNNMTNTNSNFQPNNINQQWQSNQNSNNWNNNNANNPIDNGFRSNFSNYLLNYDSNM